MKKIFNLAVILATLMGAATFTSCEDDEEKAQEKAEEQALTEIQVVAGGKYSVSNAVKAFSFEVKSVAGSIMNTPKDQVVVIEIDGFDGQLTLSDAGASYLVWDGTQFITQQTDAAKKNVGNIVACLAGANSKANYTITSATVNDTMKGLGATESKFSKNNRAANK